MADVFRWTHALCWPLLQEHGIALLYAAIVVSCSSSVDDAQRGGPARSTVAQRPTFRSVQTTRGEITLGMPLPLTVAAAAPRDTIVGLARGSIEGAERASVTRTRAGLVRAVTVDYQQGADYAQLLAEYRESLGPPVRSELRRRGEEPVNVAVWRDDRTEFQLIRDPNRNAWTIRGQLLNRSIGP